MNREIPVPKTQEHLIRRKTRTTTKETLKKVGKFVITALMKGLEATGERVYGRDYNTVNDKDLYASEGPLYDFDYTREKTMSFFEEYRQIEPLQSFLERTNQEPGATVLDLGSGLGYESDFLKQELPSAQIISAEVSYDGAKQGHENLDLVQIQANAKHRPFPDQSISAIHCKDVLVHIEDKKQFLEEIARVLKPDGTFFLLSAHPPKGKFIKQYPWGKEAFIALAEKNGLECIESDRIVFQKDDWYKYSETPRTVLLFKKK